MAAPEISAPKTIGDFRFGVERRLELHKLLDQVWRKLAFFAAHPAYRGNFLAFSDLHKLRGLPRAA